MEQGLTQQKPESFFLSLEGICRRGSREDYALVSLDYDHFNYINDLFGYTVGDQVLRQMEENFQSDLGPGEYFSRLYADQFVFLLRYCSEGELVDRVLHMSNMQEGKNLTLPRNYNLICSGGILPLRKRDGDPMLLMDFANFARKRAKGNHRSTILLYDDEMLREQQWCKMVTSNMEPAMQTGEFDVFFQPKIRLKTGAVAGAEALARWKSREMGLIEPDFFLPIMEGNGFVTRLDFHILEKVCIFLRRNLDEGKAMPPISVNFSKLHTGNRDFPRQVREMVDSYHLPHELVEVEITEYSSSSSLQALIDTVIQLKKFGFSVSMDDFGKGYSSLSDLKNLPLDTIKFDRAFLQDSPDYDRGRHILAKLVEMVKSLHMNCVVEGVEEQEQAEFLHLLGCDIGQGYYFSRPIEMACYERFLAEHPIEGQEETDEAEVPLHRGEVHAFQLGPWEQYSLGKTIDMGLMKGWLDREVHIESANDRALGYLGTSRKDFLRQHGNQLLPLVAREDREKLVRALGKLEETGRPVSFQVRIPGEKKLPRTLRGKITRVVDEKGLGHGLFAFQDVTKELEETWGLRRSLEGKMQELAERTEAAAESRESQRIQEEIYHIAFDLTDSSLFDWDFATDHMTFSERHMEMLGRHPLEEQVSCNPAVRGFVHPEDLEDFESWVEETYRRPGVHQAEYRLLDGEKKYQWYRVRSTAICDKNGLPLRAVGSFSNIDEEKQIVERLTVKSQMDPLTRLLNREEFRVRAERRLLENPEEQNAFFMLDVDDFKGVNDRMGHLYGDTLLQQVSEKLRQVFRKGDLVARMGGDEFAVLMCACDSEERIHAKAERVLQAMREILREAQVDGGVSVSIGVARAPEDAKTYDRLYHLADLAMYGAKKRGKNCFMLYDAELGKPLLDDPA